jgi:hypothetical protein
LWLDYTHGSLRPSSLAGRVAHVALVMAALGALATALWRRRSFLLTCIAALLVSTTIVNAVLVSEPRHLLPLLPLLFAGAAAAAFQLGLTARREHPAT